MSLCDTEKEVKCVKEREKRLVRIRKMHTKEQAHTQTHISLSLSLAFTNIHTFLSSTLAQTHTHIAYLSLSLCTIISVASPPEHILYLSHTHFLCSCTYSYVVSVSHTHSLSLSLSLFHTLYLFLSVTERHFLTWLLFSSFLSFQICCFDSL